MEERIGLIDIGSNTIRLVIFSFNKDTGLNEILNIKTPARLSQYLMSENKMNDEGIHVLKETLSSFKKVATKFKVKELHPIATAAIRQSENRDDLIKQLKKDINIEIQVVPEEDEAFYGYYAISHTTDIEDGISVDIGGGSTEVTLFKDKKLKKAHSFPFGVVTLKRQFFGEKDHNDKSSIKSMEKFLSEQFSQLDWLNDQEIALVGVGGSARNVARIHQSSHSYPIGGVHNYTMSLKDIDEVYNTIRKSSRDDLTNLDGLSRDRIDIILPAVSVFKTLFKKIDATQFTFSRKGIREGYVMNLIRQRHPDEFKKENVRQDALRHLAKEYHIEEDSANRRLKLAQSLLNQLLKESDLKITDNEKNLFSEGAYIYYLGSFIDSDSSSPHTYYLIANSMINGFSHKDRVKLALLASFKNKSLLKFYCKETEWFTSKEVDTLQALGGIIKFVNALNISYTSFVEEVKLKEKKDDKYELYVYYKGEPIAEEYQANRQKKHIEKILKGKVSIIFTKS
ncbi:exopolyphosphatase [Staphylococcus saccharolyticus]|uniref:exopolyphosphatase n=1 Tax=Staphylococcus saccharolyticus TaxID=33028 RepID=A0A380GYG7_9STAP|nr:exopolyphosphatase [Staphylococcus saccharolyticus]MBL7564746.1 exopolyphosphatase [Staphylococcus saccharolyticus]MBL7570990.1 exopolyphosphatase [Staphylococcus saccharolyticus]QQB98842.1 exopolyphosphatase [Staphylococcus saccharolyticus]RTX93310.1 exopolyphosphatase [Staphylococcus saccharolyticus]TAA99731.1 exopolyphosphatase [Staphylococcus saccharolyticus]